MEYVWFNNVETKPSTGYPKQWEDQDRWKGGWQVKNGKLQLKRGPRSWLLAGIFSNGLLPTIDEYYEPYTFDYQKLQKAPLMKTAPTAQPVSYITGEVMDKIEGSAAWEDDLGGVDVEAVEDINLKGVQREIYAQYANTFMFYLPRLCNHCLNPGCVASCPSGSIYKREEDGIVLVDQDKCRGWRMCMTGCPYKKVYYNWSSGKAEKCIFCYPRIESGCPTVCSESCTGRIRYVGVVLYDADKIKELASTENDADLYEAQRSVFLDPFNLDVIEGARAEGISDEWITAAQKSPVRKLIEWGLAFPMHPEYRTLPMVWYVPPLVPDRERHRCRQALDGWHVAKSRGLEDTDPVSRQPPCWRKHPGRPRCSIALTAHALHRKALQRFCRARSVPEERIATRSYQRSSRDRRASRARSYA
jgi:nitrate reductase beta subunit